MPVETDNDYSFLGFGVFISNTAFVSIMQHLYFHPSLHATWSRYLKPVSNNNCESRSSFDVINDWSLEWFLHLPHTYWHMYDLITRNELLRKAQNGMYTSSDILHMHSLAVLNKDHYNRVHGQIQDLHPKASYCSRNHEIEPLPEAYPTVLGIHPVEIIEKWKQDQKRQTLLRDMKISTKSTSGAVKPTDASTKNVSMHHVDCDVDFAERPSDGNRSLMKTEQDEAPLSSDISDSFYSISYMNTYRRNKEPIPSNLTRIEEQIKTEFTVFIDILNVIIKPRPAFDQDQNLPYQYGHWYYVEEFYRPFCDRASQYEFRRTMIIHDNSNATDVVKSSNNVMTVPANQENLVGLE